MSVFKSVETSEQVLERFRSTYRTPLYFEWPHGNAFTARGVPVVYILGFENGLTKVGQSRDFLTRLSANRSNRRVQGSSLKHLWRLGSDHPTVDEATLIRLASEMGGVRVDRSPEWFTGVDVLELIAAAESRLVQSEVAA